MVWKCAWPCTSRQLLEMLQRPHTQWWGEDPPMPVSQWGGRNGLGASWRHEGVAPSALVLLQMLYPPKLSFLDLCQLKTCTGPRRSIGRQGETDKEHVLRPIKSEIEPHLHIYSQVGNWAFFLLYTRPVELKQYYRRQPPTPTIVRRIKTEALVRLVKWNYFFYSHKARCVPVLMFGKHCFIAFSTTNKKCQICSPRKKWVHQ